jgi:hypothetical protein
METSLPPHFRSGPEFHAEWLRDEPCDATATGSGSYILTARCQLPPGNGEHEIRMRALIFIAFRFLFSHFLEKRPFNFRGFRLVLSYSLQVK